MARALAERIGVQAVLLEHSGPPQVIECLKAGACDVAFLPRDARVASVGDFSFPYIQSEYTFWYRRAPQSDELRMQTSRAFVSRQFVVMLQRRP